MELFEGLFCFVLFCFLQLTNTCSSPACWKCWLNWVFAKDIKMISKLKKKKDQYRSIVVDILRGEGEGMGPS